MRSPTLQSVGNLSAFLEVRDSRGAYRAYVDGAWVDWPHQRTLAVRSPVDGSLLGNVPAMAQREIEHTFEAARSAQPHWAALSVSARAQILHRAADLIAANASVLVPLLCREIAKSRKDSFDEVTRSAEFLHFIADEGCRMTGEALDGGSFPGAGHFKLGVAMRVPLGVVLAIPPFNYPLNLAVTKLGPALISGNAVVMKPPTQGSLTAHHLVAALAAAGIPPGVLGLVTGRGSEIGELLVRHPAVSMVAFTGSTETGRALAASAGMVPVVLELGGKDAAIVLADADLDRAASEIVAGAFAYSGQRCTAIKRVLVVEDVADGLAQRLADRAGKLTVGLPEQDPVITPLISAESADYVHGLYEDAVQRGAKPLTPWRREGNLVWPVVLDHVTADMRVAWEEQFGPILPMLRVRTADQATRLCNQSTFGLQCCVFTRDMDQALHLARQVDVGTVQLNGKSARGPDNFPFLGAKGSGMGTPGARYSIESMTRIKLIVFNPAQRAA